jgi:hypothetical protein
VDSITHETLDGYEHPLFEVVRKVNGVKVKNIQHLALLLREANARQTELVTFQFANPLFGPLVLDRQAAYSATNLTQDTLGIRRTCSEDLLNATAIKSTVGRP